MLPLNGPPSCDSGRFLTGNVAASGRTIGQFVTTLADWVGRPVIDKTGLTTGPNPGKAPWYSPAP